MRKVITANSGKTVVIEHQDDGLVILEIAGPRGGSYARIWLTPEQAARTAAALTGEGSR
jgi:hypothetical protein